MKLDLIMSGIEFTLLSGELDRQINGICYDSREVQIASAFVAITGFSVDGHNYISKAIENGATTLIVEKDIVIHNNLTILRLKIQEKLCNLKRK